MIAPVIARLIATVGGVGYLRPAPGTWGSVAALPLAWALHTGGGFPMLAIASLAFFILGWWATVQMTSDQGDHDPAEVVIDEVVGQWVALAPLSYAAWDRGLDILAMWPGWIAGFVLFRLFDIWKPLWIGWADRRADGLGVMLDDVIAGVFAALGVMVLAVAAHTLVLG